MWLAKCRIRQVCCGKDDVVGKAIGSSDSETLGLILEGKRKVKTNVWLAHCCVR